MKNFLKLFGIITLVLAVVFFAAACGDDEEEIATGKLTIVGFDFDIGEKYVMADAWIDGVYYFAAANYVNGELTLGEIKNKIVTLSVWEHKGSEPVLYSGNEEIDFDIYLFIDEDALDNDVDADDTMNVTVKFKKGIGIGEIQ